MRTITAFVVVLISFRQNTLSMCSNRYGSEPCKFVPSLPGKVPPCAKPGLTYCEHPTHYPGQVIEHLIQNWQYDYSTLLSNESPEEFHSYFVPLDSRHQAPKPVYGPPPQNSIHRYHNPLGSIHIPIPFNPPSNSYGAPLPNLHQNYSDGRPIYTSKLEVPPSHLYNYNIPFKSGIPNQHQQNNYPSFSLPQVEHNNNWWKRFRRDTFSRRNHTLRRKRHVMRGFVYSPNSNASVHTTRVKRQTQTERQLCQFRTQYIMPRAALNNKGNWMYIVNMPEVDNKYTQLVKSEICISQDCDGVCGLPAGHTSKCEQKYAQKRLIALEGEGNQLYTDVFWFPSCCVCTITRTN